VRCASGQKVLARLLQALGCEGLSHKVSHIIICQQIRQSLIVQILQTCVNGDTRPEK
jgi:hypothetical protein